MNNIAVVFRASCPDVIRKQKTVQQERILGSRIGLSITQLCGRIACLGLACWLWTPTVGAAESVLSDWIGQALEQNQEAIAARAAWHAAQEQMPQARSFKDPTIGVAFMRMDNTRLADPDMTEITVAQQLPWFGKRGARIDAADRAAEAAGFRYMQTLRNVEARMKTAYWQLWTAQRAVAINQQNVALLTDFEAIARARYESGQGLQADWLRAQVERDRLETDLLTMEQELEVAQARINRLLSEPVETPRTVDAPSHIPAMPGSLDEWLEQERLSSPVLFSLRREIEAREAAVQSARREYTPDIEFRVKARQQSGRSGFQEYDTGVAINVPWFWRDKYSARIREAQAELERAEALFRNAWDATRLAIKEFYTAADAERRTIKLFEEVILPRTNEFLKSTRSAYESGRVTLLELINAQKAWEDANLAYERARARYGGSVAKLREITKPWTQRERDTGLLEPDMNDIEDKQ